MKIINLGSINVDYVYQTEHIVLPGETIASRSMTVHPGGKGANQSVALARAGAEVLHVGMVGKDTQWMKERLTQEKVDTRFVRVATDGTAGGHAIIQVDAHGQNSIIIFGGANQCIPAELFDQALLTASKGDWLVMQNEINLTPLAMKAAHDAGLRICFNPAPMDRSVLSYPLDLVDLFILNEIEAASLADSQPDSPMEAILEQLCGRYPSARVCITLGKEGALFHSAETGTLRQKSYPVKAVDTTAAGDTFVGYFLHELTSGTPPAQALEFACRASAITVSRPGAIPSIPLREEVVAQLHGATNGNDHAN